MSKYDIEYLRNMRIQDFACEPSEDIISVLIDHLKSINGRSLKLDVVRQYNKIFMKYYTQNRLCEYLDAMQNVTDRLNCVDELDPKFVVKFKFKVMTKGDLITRKTLEGIYNSYLDFSPRHIIMFMYAYMFMPALNLRILVDFFSNMDILSDEDVLECTRIFMQKQWSVDTILADLSSGLTLSLLYLKRKKRYREYYTARVKWLVKKDKYDYFNQRMPVIPKDYKPDRGLFAI